MSTEEIIIIGVANYVDIYNEENGKTDDRYRSFDLCYGYFKSNRKNLTGQNIEKSCYVLWSYLASWGMLRGSSYLLSKNASYLKPLIEYINSDGDDMFDVDVCSYGNEGVIEMILESYGRIKELLTPVSDKNTKPSKTLITKIMLGVFGCIPAYDRYFIAAFKGKKGFLSPQLNISSIKCIAEFYENNKDEIDSLVKEIWVKNFDGNDTTFNYPIAKIVDMCGFVEGLKNDKNSKLENNPRWRRFSGTDEDAPFLRLSETSKTEI